MGARIERMRFATAFLILQVLARAQVVPAAGFEPARKHAIELEQSQRYPDAIDAFRHLFVLQPHDEQVLEGLTTSNYRLSESLTEPTKTGKLEEARKWNQRWLLAAPTSRDAHYWAGTLVWAELNSALLAAWAVEGYRFFPGVPLPPSPRKEALISKFALIADQGISHLRLAIEIDPNADDAMSYLNLLIQERAQLRDTKSLYQRDIEEANRWLARAIEAKRSAAGFQPANGATRIHVDGNVQEAKVIRKVEPVCPASVRGGLSGTVRLNVVIDADGSGKTIYPVSGDKALIPAAIDAVKQWQFQPTLFNGSPVEVVAQVAIEMPCGK